MKNPDSGQPKKGKSIEEIKKITRSLEKIPLLKVRDKIFLVLILTGSKKASDVYISAGASAGEIKELEAEIKRAGLVFKLTDRTIEDKDNRLISKRVCLVAVNQKDLDLFSEKWFGDQINDPTAYKKIGEMSGFPQTAIDAYDAFSNPELSQAERDESRNLIYSEAEKIEKLKNEPEVIPFATLFYMSKAHFDSEVETARKWAKEINAASPILLNMFISEYKSENKKI